jgi:CubicO group peptidase (beta-lactamase class C family)
MNRFFSLVLFFFAFATSFGQESESKPSVSIDNAVKTRIDSTLKSFVQAGNIAGVSALIFEKNQEVYFNAFGYADREAKLTMDRNTIVRIYSMTKPITGVALMKLYEQALFNWMTRFQNTLLNLPICKCIKVLMLQVI